MPGSSKSIILTGVMLFAVLFALALISSAPLARADSLVLPLDPYPAGTRLPYPGEEVPLGRLKGTPGIPIQASQSIEGVLADSAVPTLRASFPGLRMEPNSKGIIKSPPDTHAAVGPDRLVAVTNGHVAIYDKMGSLLAGGDGSAGSGAVDLIAFCRGANCFDPKVIYDQYSDRFVAVALEGRSSTESRMHLLVSKTSTPANLDSDWVWISMPAGVSIGSDSGWFDYPGLGVSPEVVVITGNIFDDDSPRALGTKIRVLNKADLYDGDSQVTYKDLDYDLANGGFTQQPAHHFGAPPTNTFYLIQRWTKDRIRVSAITDILGTPSLSAVTIPTADQGECAAVQTAPQMGTSVGLDTICGRMLDAVWRDGFLWGVLTGADSGGNRAMVHYFQVDTGGFPGGSPAITQHGVVDGGPGEFTFMPAIAVDACGNTGLTYTQSSLIRFPEMRYTGRLAADPPGALQAPGVVIASQHFYDDFTSVDRWGDYAFAGIDPSDGGVWIAHEYAAEPAGSPGTGRWGTWLASFDFGCGLQPPPTPPIIPTSTPAVQLKLPVVVQDSSIP